VVAAGLLALGVGAPLTVAHRNILPLERWYGDAAVGIASRVGGAGATAPPAGRGAVVAGMRAYTGSCASCHNANGDGRGLFGPATYPPATDLRGHDAREKTDAQLFWIIKNGVSFTGMPAFGGQYGDAEVWALVAYVRALQGQASSGAAGEAAPASLVVPTPTADQLAPADPQGDDVHRGAAVYFAQGCASCHGATGEAPGELALRTGQARETPEALRQGRPGMPRYGPEQVSDAELADLLAYLRTFPAGGRGRA
jgi:mono/diheme cytochrome c family protein